MAAEKNISVEERRTTMNVSLTVDDKKFLKVYAAEHDTSVAALIHDAVERLRREELSDGRE